MDFRFTDDQRLFAATVREFLDKECTPEAIRAGEVRLFGPLAEMGVAGMLAAAAAGGMGMSFTDLVLVLEEAGRAALPDPLMEHACVAVPALTGTDWESRATSGEILVTVAAPYAPDADRAGLVLAIRGDDVIAIEAPDLTPQRSLDPTRRLFAVSGDGVRVDDAVSVQRRGAFGAAALSLGVADRMIAMAATYATEREQFGKPIGEFQLLKGLLADALLALTFARPAVYRAADSLSRDAGEVDRDVAMAKAMASDAVAEAARAALQVHGAIGYTEEHDLHIWLKRAWSLVNAWGGPSEHRATVARAVIGL